jgi:hypothetical protein
VECLQRYPIGGKLLIDHVDISRVQGHICGCNSIGKHFANGSGATAPTSSEILAQRLVIEEYGEVHANMKTCLMSARGFRLKL